MQACEVFSFPGSWRHSALNREGLIVQCFTMEANFCIAQKVTSLKIEIWTLTALSGSRWTTAIVVSHRNIHIDISPSTTLWQHIPQVYLCVTSCTSRYPAFCFLVKVLESWKCSRMRLWALWSSGRCPAHGRRLEWDGLKVPSIPNHAVVLQDKSMTFTRSLWNDPMNLAMFPHWRKKGRRLIDRWSCTLMCLGSLCSIFHAQQTSQDRSCLPYGFLSLILCPRTMQTYYCTES